MDTVNIAVGEVLHETDLAFLLDIDGDEIWIPKSVINFDESEEIEVGNIMLEISIAQWFADKEGIA